MVSFPALDLRFHFLEFYFIPQSLPGSLCPTKSQYVLACSNKMLLCSPGWPQTLNSSALASQCWDSRQEPPHLSSIPFRVSSGTSSLLCFGRTQRPPSTAEPCAAKTGNQPSHPGVRARKPDLKKKPQQRIVWVKGDMRKPRKELYGRKVWCGLACTKSTHVGGALSELPAHTDSSPSGCGHNHRYLPRKCYLPRA